MLTKVNLVRNGIPTIVAFIILFFAGDMYVLPTVFRITDSGNVNLVIWIAVDATMLFLTFYGTRWVLFKLGWIKNWLGK